jgi:hypothetical protein
MVGGNILERQFIETMDTRVAQEDSDFGSWLHQYK